MVLVKKKKENSDLPDVDLIDEEHDGVKNEKREKGVMAS